MVILIRGQPICGGEGIKRQSVRYPLRKGESLDRRQQGKTLREGSAVTHRRGVQPCAVAYKERSRCSGHCAGSVSAGFQILRQLQWRRWPRVAAYHRAQHVFHVATKNSHRAKDESYEEESHGRDDSNPALVDGASLNN